MRVIRILVYEGDERFIRASLEDRSVKGEWSVQSGRIFETFVEPYTLPRWGLLDHDQEKRDQEEGEDDTDSDS